MRGNVADGMLTYGQLRVVLFKLGHRDLTVITPVQARKQGLDRYFTGKPCRNGHIAERTLVSGQCTECNRINAQRHQ